MSDSTSGSPSGTTPGSTAGSEQVAPARPVTSAVIDLLGMLAYAELAAFDRMAADARLAPDLGRRALLSEMAGNEIANYRRIVDRIEELGATADGAMAPFEAALAAYHDQTEPNDWYEALTKAYVGDSMADDFMAKVAELLDEADRRLALEVLHNDRYAQFAADEIRAALAIDPDLGNRLSMWARRLVGEAITQAYQIAGDRPDLLNLIIREGTDGRDLQQLVKRLTSAHTARMAAIGLNN